MALTKLLATQIKTIAGKTVEKALSDLANTKGSGQLTLSDGTVINYGILAPSAQIAANGVATITVVFDTEFPNSCDFFDALPTPALSTDFYGITSLVSVGKKQVQFTVRNGATAQALAGGLWFAFGK